jgi:hypothetical protein
MRSSPSPRCTARCADAGPRATLVAPSALTTLVAPPAPTTLAAPSALTTLVAPPAPTTLVAPPAPTTLVAPSAPTVLAVAALGALLGLAACGHDTDPHCDRSFLRYDNFGAPFLVNWCRACHSAGLPPDMRQLAPANVNFDTLAEIRTWSSRIDYTTAHGTSMPPAGGPSPDERDMLGEWLRCGAR